MVTITDDSTAERVRFAIREHATLVWPIQSSRVASLLDVPQSGESCLEMDSFGSTNGDAIADLALLRDYRTPYVISSFLTDTNGSYPAVQTSFRMNRPHNLSQFIALWNYLAEPVSVLSLVPLEAGFVLRVMYEAGVVFPKITFGSTNVATSDSIETSDLQLCLMRVDPAAFQGIPKDSTFSVFQFQYAYVQVMDVDRHENGNISFKMFVVPASSTQLRRTGALSILIDTCKQANDIDCARWRSFDRPFKRVFPHLASVPGVADSVSFLDFINVLEFLRASNRQNVEAISLLGVTFPMSKRMLVILSAFVLVIQTYLLALIQVATSAFRTGTRSRRPKILWIALDHERFTKFLWTSSAVLPPLSIVVALLTMLFNTWGDVLSFTPQFELAQFGTTVTAVLAIAVMIFTLRETDRLRSCFYIWHPSAPTTEVRRA